MINNDLLSNMIKSHQLQVEIYSFRILILLLLYTICFDFVLWATDSYILKDSFYYSALGNQFGFERVQSMIELNKRYQIINYLITPMFLVIKWILLSSIIYIGMFLFNENISYSNCIKIIQIAELAALFGSVTKLIWFIFEPPQTFDDIQYFQPLSITQIFRHSDIPRFLIYPLQQLNIFEILYWLLIAGGIGVFTQKSFSKSLKITASSYGIAMVLWCLVIVFIQLQFS